MGGFGCDECLENDTASLCSANSEILRSWHYSVGSFFMKWTCPLTILHRSLNAEVYKDSLTPCILFRVEDQFGDDDCLYQHDSAPCHKARSLSEWFMENKVPEMDWPAQCPDLNSIEHLWDESERRFRSRTQHPASLTALATALQEKWAAILPETFRHLVESLPGRVRAVKKTKGGPTQY
jgi:hypothetical protein